MISFNISSGVAVYGGFAGTETARKPRNPATNVTTLSGEIGSNIILNDNSYHVVHMDGTTTSVTSTTVLDGFTITAGYVVEGGNDHS